jgi:hypothetical protein
LVFLSIAERRLSSEKRRLEKIARRKEDIIK